MGSKRSPKPNIPESRLSPSSIDIPQLSGWNQNLRRNLGGLECRIGFEQRSMAAAEEGVTYESDPAEARCPRCAVGGASDEEEGEGSDGRGKV